MKIEVRLFANLAEFLPAGSRGGIAILDVPARSSVDDVGRLLGIPTELSRIVLVNGQDAELEHRLAPDDILTIFPPLAGGAQDMGGLERPEMT